jgi:hypothetical protein
MVHLKTLLAILISFSLVASEAEEYEELFDTALTVFFCTTPKPIFVLDKSNLITLGRFSALRLLVTEGDLFEEEDDDDEVEHTESNWELPLEQLLLQAEIFFWLTCFIEFVWYGVEVKLYAAAELPIAVVELVLPEDIVVVDDSNGVELIWWCVFG